MEKWRAADAGAFEVWPENHATVRLFLGLNTQWRRAAGRLVGLDYSVIESTARLMAINVDQDLFANLRIMENAALGCIHGQADPEEG